MSRPQTMQHSPGAKRRQFIALLLILLAFPAHAQTVTDGDTLKLNGKTWRLWGIDAPETRQACPDGYPAGIEATAYLRALIRDRRVTCEERALSAGRVAMFGPLPRTNEEWATQLDQVRAGWTAAGSAEALPDSEAGGAYNARPLVTNQASL